MSDMSSEETTVVYFILSGKVMNEGKIFRVNDVLVFRGALEFLLLAVDANAEVIKVLIYLGGTPSRLVFNWEDFNKVPFHKRNEFDKEISPRGPDPD